MAKTKNAVKAVKQAEVTQNISVEKETQLIKLELNPSMLKNAEDRQMLEETLAFLKKTFPEAKPENGYIITIDRDDLDKWTKATETKSKKAPKPPVKLLKNKKKS